MLKALLSTHPLLLVECAVAERLRRLPGVVLHPTLFNTPLIYGPVDARAAMEGIYLEYIATAREAGLPILLAAPTWRLDARRVAEAGAPVSINADAVEFLIDVRDRMSRSQGDMPPILIGALLGPWNDCYRPDLAPSAEDAAEFHFQQASELGKTTADFLLAQTLPAVREAIGIARVMAATEKSYLISFCTGTDGHVLDGTPLSEAMAEIDASVNRPPLGYFVNCTHPRFLLDAYAPGQLDRLVGIQANGSAKDVTMLDGSSVTVTDPLPSWTAAMRELHLKHQVPMLGGCCGTSLPHLRALAGLECGE